jgi:hypothetical protein
VHTVEQEMLQEIRLKKMRFLQPIAMFWMNLSRIRGEGHGSESGKGRGQNGEKMLDKAGWG